MSSDNMITILILVAGMIVIVLLAMIVALIVTHIKEKRLEKQQKEQEKEKQVKKSDTLYTVESVLDFMDFEKIEDNMIVQKRR